MHIAYRTSSLTVRLDLDTNVDPDLDPYVHARDGGRHMATTPVALRVYPEILYAMCITLAMSENSLPAFPPHLRRQRNLNLRSFLKIEDG